MLSNHKRFDEKCEGSRQNAALPVKEVHSPDNGHTASLPEEASEWTPEIPFKNVSYSTNKRRKNIY